MSQLLKNVLGSLADQIEEIERWVAAGCPRHFYIHRGQVFSLGIQPQGGILVCRFGVVTDDTAACTVQSTSDISVPQFKDGRYQVPNNPCTGSWLTLPGVTRNSSNEGNRVFLFNRSLQVKQLGFLRDDSQMTIRGSQINL